MKKSLVTMILVSAVSACSQIGASAWDDAYGGVDKSYDTQLLELREEMAPKFETREFVDPVSGRVMTYNLFIPDNYDPNQSYPLVLFMADGSTTGKGAMAPLKQGYGGFIWATPESQAQHESFVLVPAFEGPDNVVNDKWEVSDEVDSVVRLLDQVVNDYSIDEHRLYTTGQSMGGMISFYLNARYPELFAASLFVGSQWDVNVLDPLAEMNFFYIVSAADPKASKGMAELGDLLSSKGVAYATTEFSAQLPQAEQEAQVERLISKQRAINFIQFTPGTVPPEGESGKRAEHMYSFDYAYQLSGVRNWLFSQSK
ncbi:pyrroline-5-carboxylate reductase [Vibrio scophthalmi]|uniref:carboxylesterase family protein n=1 Tax=Vibrio scophthalmi TaxID=45658 RepID=UPI002FF0E4FA